MAQNLESELAVSFLLGIFPIFVACIYLELLKYKKSPSPPKVKTAKLEANLDLMVAVNACLTEPDLTRMDMCLMKTWLHNCPMFGMRGSGGLLTGISHHVLENLSLRCQRVQCFRVGNTDIPDNKRIEVALQHVHGVGRRRAHQIISELGIGNRLTKDLTGVELNSLREEVSKYLTGGDLRRCVDGDIKKLADIRSYRGFRHACMLPCRGQRTKTNARTMKEHKRRDKGILTRSQNLAEWMEKRQERDQEK